MTASEATEPQPSSTSASARAGRQPDPAATHPLAIVPAALVSLSAVVLFGFLAYVVEGS